MNPRILCLFLMGVSMSLLTGFAPFNSDGLLRMQVTQGMGVEGQEEGDVAATMDLEAIPLFHSLSSRYGGGGVLIYAEFGPEQAGVSSLFLMDLRHGGLPDLERTELDAQNGRRLEPFYQEWDTRGDIFITDQVKGTVVVEDIFRGQINSAVAISFDMTMVDAGRDQRLGTEDDLWRRFKGSLATSPTVAQAVNSEADLVRSRRDEDVRYAPDGDIYVSCVGETSIEEEVYQEDSVVYEDEDGGGCEGDTWDDDSEDPQDSGGCAGEQSFDEGEPFYDDDDDGGGCDGDDDFDDSDDSDDGGGCEGDSEDDGFDDDDFDDDDIDSGCDDSDIETDTFGAGSGIGAGPSAPTSLALAAGPACGVASGAGMSPGRRAHLRRYLEGLTKPQRHSVLVHRFDRGSWGPMRYVLRYLPFLILGLVIHLWRRRARRRGASMVMT